MIPAYGSLNFNGGFDVYVALGDYVFWFSYDPSARWLGNRWMCSFKKWVKTGGRDYSGYGFPEYVVTVTITNFAKPILGLYLKVKEALR